MRRIARELGLGAGIALGGGRESLVRMALTALGVGLGVVVLLGAASRAARARRRRARASPRATPSTRSRRTPATRC